MQGQGVGGLKGKGAKTRRESVHATRLRKYTPIKTERRFDFPLTRSLSW